MTLTMKIAIALLGIAAFAPWHASAASLYGSASASPAEPGMLSQAGLEIGTSPYIELNAEADVTAGTGTPSEGSAGDDAEDTEEDKPATDADIRAYADALTMQNAAVAHAEAERKGKTLVEYYHPGKLFGFITVAVKAKTVIDADESGVVKVKTSMPFWNFLVAGTGGIDAAVDQELSATGAVMADAAVPTAGAKVRLIDAIVAAHAHAAATAGGSAEAGA